MRHALPVARCAARRTDGLLGARLATLPRARAAAALPVAALLLIASGTLAPVGAASCFLPAEPVVVDSAAVDLTVDLADGRRVRLADVRPDASAGPGVIDGVRGPAVLLRADGIAEDRHGRTVGDIRMDGREETLSLALLRAGVALVDPATLPDGCHGEMLAAEAEAERGGVGLWREGGPVLAADSAGLAQLAGRYAIVEGAVVSVGTTRQTLYLNFGTDHRTDFTALARRRDARRWEDAITRLEGRRVRVRGVLEAWNGGLIRIEHPAQVDDLASPLRAP